jgi:hypothetical protein
MYVRMLRIIALNVSVSRCPAVNIKTAANAAVFVVNSLALAN